MFSFDQDQIAADMRVAFNEMAAKHPGLVLIWHASYPTEDGKRIMVLSHNTDNVKEKLRFIAEDYKEGDTAEVIYPSFTKPK